MESLHFTYRCSRNELSERRVTQWKEEGHYITGFCSLSGQVRTFRKDRVTQYLSGCESALIDPYPGPPPNLHQRRDTGEKSLQILFTGFAKAKRAELEEIACAAGLQVRKDVTKGLMFMCGGSNAGPAKLERARNQSVYILDEQQFHALLETGELPE